MKSKKQSLVLHASVQTLHLATRLNEAHRTIFDYIQKSLERANVIPRELECVIGVLGIPSTHTITQRRDGRVDLSVIHKITYEPALVVAYRTKMKQAVDVGIAFTAHVRESQDRELHTNCSYIVLELFDYRRYLRRAWELDTVLPAVVVGEAIEMVRSFAVYPQI